MQPGMQLEWLPKSEKEASFYRGLERDPFPKFLMQRVVSKAGSVKRMSEKGRDRLHLKN